MYIYIYTHTYTREAGRGAGLLVVPTTPPTAAPGRRGCYTSNSNSNSNSDNSNDNSNSNSNNYNNNNNNDNNDNNSNSNSNCWETSGRRRERTKRPRRRACETGAMRRTCRATPVRETPWLGNETRGAASGPWPDRQNYLATACGSFFARFLDAFRLLAGGWPPRARFQSALATGLRARLFNRYERAEPTLRRSGRGRSALDKRSIVGLPAVRRLLVRLSTGGALFVGGPGGALVAAATSRARGLRAGATSYLQLAHRALTSPVVSSGLKVTSLFGPGPGLRGPPTRRPDSRRRQRRAPLGGVETALAEAAFGRSRFRQRPRFSLDLREAEKENGENEYRVRHETRALSNPTGESRSHRPRPLLAKAGKRIPLPVSVTKNTPFAGALAMQSSRKNCSPAPDLVLRKLVFPPCLSLRWSVLFHRPASPPIR